jgi:hypothetical protein
MLLLVTIALVVVALVLLVVGFIQHSLGFIYGSILCSVAAALILILVAGLGRRRALRLSPVGASVGFEAFADASDGAPLVDDDPPGPPPAPATVVAPAVPGPVGVAPAGAGAAEVEWDEDDYILPIEAYDQLRANEIIPLLGQLEPDELEDVRAWEMEGRARVSITRRIDTLLRAAGIEPEAEPEGHDARAVVEQPGGNDTADADVGASPRPQETTVSPPPPFPIAGYDRLRANIEPEGE